MIDEGVIKFSFEHDRHTLSARRFGELACALTAWRDVLAHAKLIGELPPAMGSIGYGNVSGRTSAPAAPRGARSFLITGTQTGGIARLGLEHYAHVRSYDYRLNRVVSSGTIDPSSESMTHGAIYDLSPRIRYVLHGHSSVIWSNADRLRIPQTAPTVAYGTPEMAFEVARLYRDSPLADVRILSMAGHEDGIVTFGHSLEEAGSTFINYLARAYQQTCMAR